MKNNKTGIVLLSFFMLLSIAFLAYYYKVNHEVKRNLLPVVLAERNHHVAPFAFTNQDGKTITNQDVAGKICVVSYFFATCKGICPKMNENMSKVYTAYKGNDKVKFMCHTVDPGKDSVPALKAYSLRFDADPKQWMFLTGGKKELYEMARYSYLISAEDDTAGVKIEDDFIHDRHYALVDGFGRIRGFYDGLQQKDIDRLIKDIAYLIDEKP